MEKSVRTWYRHFEYQVIFFELSNALASFQGYINKILAKRVNVFVIVYRNDIRVYTKNVSQGYINAVWWILNLLRKNRRFANLQKYWFHQNEVCFLKYVVSA